MHKNNYLSRRQAPGPEEMYCTICRFKFLKMHNVKNIFNYFTSNVFFQGVEPEFENKTPFNVVFARKYMISICNIYKFIFLVVQ